MRFPGIRLVEQTEQKFRRIACVVKKRVTVIAGLLFKKAPTKNGTHKIFTFQNRNICKQDTENIHFLCQSSSPYVLRSTAERFGKLAGRHFVHTLDESFFASKKRCQFE